MGNLALKARRASFFMARAYLSPSLTSLTKREIEVLWMLAGNMDSINRVSTSRLFIQEVKDCLGISATRIYALIGGLVEKNAVLRLARSDYMVNPEIFFKSRASGVKALEKEYARCAKNASALLEASDKDFVEAMNRGKWGNGRENGEW